MKLLKKLALVLLPLVLLSQIPFAYRRYELGRLNAAIQVVNSSRRVARPDEQFTEYKGVSHVHSFLGGHSTGTFPEIISAAQANQLQFVIMTEHVEKDFDTAAMTLKGSHGEVLFVNGNEVRTANGDRLLTLPGGAPANNGRAQGHAAIAAYPEEFKGWEAGGYDGVEVYNVYSNARRINPAVAFFDSLWSRRGYPDLMFATFYKRPDESLRKWDLALTRAKVSATAGNDAHANIGFSLNDAGGKTLFGLKLDPYETSFRLVRLHVLIPREQQLDTNSLIQAIKDGHCFIGFDLFGESLGFRFMALNSSETRIQGDEISLRSDTRLAIDVPVSSRIVVFKDGNSYLDESGLTYKEFTVTERGIYRVEIYLPQLGKPVGEQPWIISNPIYVR